MLTFKKFSRYERILVDQVLIRIDNAKVKKKINKVKKLSILTALARVAQGTGHSLEWPDRFLAQGERSIAVDRALNKNTKKNGKKRD